MNKKAFIYVVLTACVALLGTTLGGCSKQDTPWETGGPDVIGPDSDIDICQELSSGWTYPLEFKIPFCIPVKARVTDCRGNGIADSPVYFFGSNCYMASAHSYTDHTGVATNSACLVSFGGEYITIYAKCAGWASSLTIKVPPFEAVLLLDLGADSIGAGAWRIRP